MTATEFAQIELRTDTAANWTAVNPVPAAGEPCWESDTNKLKIGNGVTSWTALPYFSPGTAGPAAPPLFPGLVSGVSYQGTWNSGTTGTGTLTVGNLLLHPFVVPVACSVDQLIANVTATGAGTVRLGLYGSDANGKAAGLLLDAGTVTGAATGNRVITVSQALPAGLYWIASLQETAGGTWTTYAAGMGANVLGVGASGGGHMRLFKTGVAVGALPATAAGAVPDNAAAGLRTLVRVA